MACILEGVLECDVFLGEFAVEARPVGVFWGDWRGRMRGDGCLLRWRAVVGVLEDSCRRLACLSTAGLAWGDYLWVSWSKGSGESAHEEALLKPC
jgi:hypothetical protein